MEIFGLFIAGAVILAFWKILLQPRSKKGV